MSNISYAKARWLLRNTSLTFNQIAQFCEIDPLEVQAIENEETGFPRDIYNLINLKELTEAEIKRCEQNPSLKLVRNKIYDDSILLAKPVKTKAKKKR